MRPLTRSLVALLLAWTPVAAQQSAFAPDGPAFRVNASNLYWQTDPFVTRDAITGNLAVAWTTGEDIRLRMFDGSGVALTGDLAVNTTLNLGNQDQPAACFDELGSLLLSWSDRNGYDGEAMGVHARVHDANGAAPLAEFQVNVEWPASQFRPLIAPVDGGGFVVSWTGRWDGDSFFRVLDTDGTFLTGDIQVNTVTNASQIHPSVAVSPVGKIFVAFSDSSGSGGVGSGTNIWARTFDLNGTPDQVQEFHVADGVAGGDQREPRVAVDAAGNFAVVWEDAVNDGSGWGVYGRVYDSLIMPASSVFQVNTTTAGNQRAPEIAMDAAGNFLVAWEDRSSGNADITARCFDVNGQATSNEFTVNDVAAGDQTRPSIALSADGAKLAIAFEGPEVERDVFCRLYSTNVEPGTGFCFGVGCPCGNNDPNAGCANSTGSGALLTGSGSTSLAADDLVLTATGCPPQNSGLFFTGNIVFDPVFQVGDGFGCTGGLSFRYLPGASDANGVFVKSSVVSTAPPGFFSPGETRHFQAWTRDVLCGPPPAPCASPCGTNSNLSNGYTVVFEP